MKAIVIYDTNYGNTKKIAKTVAVNLGRSIKVLAVDDVKKKNLKGLQLLVVGCPVIGWNTSEKIGLFLSRLKEKELKDVKAASFDTRMKLFFFTDAAKKISKKLAEAGAEIIIKPKDFYVSKAEGPLREGETEQAVKWASEIKKAVKSQAKTKSKKT